MTSCSMKVQVRFRERLSQALNLLRKVRQYFGGPSEFGLDDKFALGEPQKKKGCCEMAGGRRV